MPPLRRPGVVRLLAAAGGSDGGGAGRVCESPGQDLHRLPPRYAPRCPRLGGRAERNVSIGLQCRRALFLAAQPSGTGVRKGGLRLSPAAAGGGLLPRSRRCGTAYTSLHLGEPEQGLELSAGSSKPVMGIPLARESNRHWACCCRAAGACLSVELWQPASACPSPTLLLLCLERLDLPKFVSAVAGAQRRVEAFAPAVLPVLSGVLPAAVEVPGVNTYSF